MNVFIIPSWHPTSLRPTWCNWVRSHISLSQRISSTTILYVDTESDKAFQDIIETDNRFFYTSIRKPCSFSRTILQYGLFLKQYCRRLEEMYSVAVKKYGKPDVLHAHVSMPAGYGASYLSAKFGIPSMVTEHYSGTISDNKYPWRLGSYYRKMRQRISGLYTVSPGYAELLHDKTGLFINGITPNPVDTSVFNLNNRNLSSADPIRICSTGKWGRIKGTDILLQALSDLPSEFRWEATIIGTTCEHGINEIPVNLKGRLNIINERVNQNDLSSLYRHSDVYVMSSRMETANVSMLEAMACGCNVVCNMIGTSETLLNSQVATFYKDSSAELASAILRCSQNLISPSVLYSYVNDYFSIESLSSKLLQEYKSMISINK